MKMLSLFFMFGIVLSTQATLAADPPMNEVSAVGMTPEMLKAMAPGENHKALNDIVGKFKYTMKWWMSPETKAEESKGTSTTKWILDGRFVQQDVKAKMNGQPFQGVGLTGYDNVKQEYQSVWLDNMGTGMMVSNGMLEKGANTLNASGTFACPMTGQKDKWFRTELRVQNKNEHTYAMFAKTPEGKEFKNMEIQYRRVN